MIIIIVIIIIIIIVIITITIVVYVSSICKLREFVIFIFSCETHISYRKEGDTSVSVTSHFQLALRSNSRIPAAVLILPVYVRAFLLRHSEAGNRHIAKTAINNTKISLLKLCKGKMTENGKT
jgi:hypothetical protein